MLRMEKMVEAREAVRCKLVMSWVIKVRKGRRVGGRVYIDGMEVVNWMDG